MTTLTKTKQSITLYGNDIKKLKAMSKGYKRNTTIGFSHYVKFTVTGDIVTVTYFNSITKNTIQLTLDTFTDNGKFAFTFPVNELKNLSTAKGVTHQFNITDNGLTVEHIEDGISQTYNVMDYEEYPKIKLNSDYVTVAELTQDTIKKLKKAALSASKSETRPVLMNVVLRKNKVVTTDSYRLYMTNSGFNVESDVLIPSQTVALIDALTDKNDTLTVEINKNNVKLGNNSVTILTEQVEGHFPEVDFLVPNSFNANIEIKEYDKFKKILEIIKKQSKFSVARLKIDFDNNKIQLSINDRNNHEGTIQSEIDVTASGELPAIAFNASYMLDVLKQVDSKNIRIKFTGGNRPFVIEDQSNNNNGEFALLLPVKIG